MPNETPQPAPSNPLFEALFAITYAVQDLSLDRLVNRYRSDTLAEGAFDFAHRIITEHAAATTPPPPSPEEE
jgi:hypothetical protein